MGEKREILKYHSNLAQVGSDLDIWGANHFAMHTDGAVLQGFEATNSSENGGFATT
jgi:hypothetical protein